MYLGLLPSGAPHFYMCTMDTFPMDVSACWFKNNVLPDLSQMSGIGVRYTNHSLRAMAITCMFTKGVPQNIIAETSGHRSTKALRLYERTCVKQQKAVTAVINSEGIENRGREERRQSGKRECWTYTFCTCYSSELLWKLIINISLKYCRTGFKCVV